MEQPTARRASMHEYSIALLTASLNLIAIVGAVLCNWRLQRASQMRSQLWGYYFTLVHIFGGLGFLIFTFLLLETVESPVGLMAACLATAFVAVGLWSLTGNKYAL